MQHLIPSLCVSYLLISPGHRPSSLAKSGTHWEYQIDPQKPSNMTTSQQAWFRPHSIRQEPGECDGMVCSKLLLCSKVITVPIMGLYGPGNLSGHICTQSNG